MATESRASRSYSRFAALLLYLKPYIDKILNTRLRCHQAKEDTNQDIHIKIYRKLGQYSGKVPLKNWVSRIAVNACTDTYNRKTRRTEIGFGELSEEQVRYIESVKACNKSDLREDRYAAQEIVTQHLPRLRSADQLVIRLHYLEGLSHREISQQTGWTESLSRVRAHRARIKLATSIRAAEKVVA